jgi:hypothetical protein
MPWIPIVPKPVKKSDCSDYSHQGGVEQTHKDSKSALAPQYLDQETDSRNKKFIDSRQSVSKKFSVATSQRSVSCLFLTNLKRFLNLLSKCQGSSEIQNDLEEPQMTSSTFKSMSGVKIVALQNPKIVQLPARPAAPFPRNAGQSMQSQDIAQLNLFHGRPPPLCFDLDSDSDTPTCARGSNSDRNQRKEVATSQISGAPPFSYCQNQPAMHEMEEISAPYPTEGPHDLSECRVQIGTRRNLLGRLAVEVVGLSFYKAAASQHRVEGASVYLVRIFLVRINLADCA